MHGWVLSVDHLLDGNWAQEGEVVSNATVGSRLDGWREHMAKQLTDGTHSPREQECLREFLQVLSNLRPYLVQCYDRKDFPRTNNEMERSIRGRKHALSPHQWPQKLERVSVALRALGRLLRVVGARCDQATTTRRAGLQAQSLSVARAASRDDRRAA
jgi:hypothetical protein